MDLKHDLVVFQLIVVHLMDFTLITLAASNIGTFPHLVPLRGCYIPLAH